MNTVTQLAKKPTLVAVTTSTAAVVERLNATVKTALQFEAVGKSLVQLAEETANHYSWLKAHGVKFGKTARTCELRRAVIVSFVAQGLADKTATNYASAFVLCYEAGVAFNKNRTVAKTATPTPSKRKPQQPGNRAALETPEANEAPASIAPVVAHPADRVGLSDQQNTIYKAYLALDAQLRKSNYFAQCDTLRDNMLGLAWFPKNPVSEVK